MINLLCKEIYIIMPLNLTGNNNHNELNLTGKYDSNINYLIKINNLKKYILTNYVIPLYSEQWNILNNNKLLIDETIKQINIYYKLYKLDELNMFLELLKILKILVNKNDLLIDLEDKTKRKMDKNNIINMVYRTTKIQILPEYEIYNSIIGKPNKKEPYNENILFDIKNLISKENITYDKIKDYISKKYQI
jgi:hypothetical protein